jgi:outer membrane protein TolC
MKKIAASLFLAVALAAGAQTNNVREMTLQQCFAEALAHNFDVQSERYAPLIALYGLRGNYGAYDPVFNFSASHTFKTADSTTNQVAISTNQFVGLPRNISRDNSFQSDLGGSLPWGMTYDFVGRVDESSGTKFGPASTNVPTTVDSGFGRSSIGSAEVDLTQHLLKDFWIDSDRLNIKQAKNNLKSSQQDLRSQIITTITAVENAFYELIYARESVKVQQQALDLAEQQLADDKARVDIGTIAASGGTLEQDQSQVASSRASLISAQFALVSAQNTLKDLITDDYKSWHETDIAPVGNMEAVRQFLDLQDSWTKGLGQRPDLLKARLGLENQGIQLQYDRNQLFPSLDLTGTFGYAGNGYFYSDSLGEVSDENRPYYTLGAKFSVPLSNARARNSLKAGRATFQQQLLGLKQLEQKIMMQIDNDVKRAQAKWENVDSYRQARIYAEAALHAEEEKYKVGKSTTFDVLNLQNKLTAARTAEIRSVADYNESLTALAQDEGSTLERRQIDFQK